MLLIVIVILIGLSLAPFFTDLFHQKDTKVCFWEWVGKEVYELIFGEISVDQRTRV